MGFLTPPPSLRNNGPKYYSPMDTDSVLVFLLLTNKMKIDNFSVKSYIFCKKTRSGKTDPFGSTVDGVPYQILTKCKKSDFILTV